MITIMQGESVLESNIMAIPFRLQDRRFGGTDHNYIIH
jgi:hypothetical protein